MKSAFDNVYAELCVGDIHMEEALSDTTKQHMKMCQLIDHISWIFCLLNNSLTRCSSTISKELRNNEIISTLTFRENESVLK